MEHREGLLVRLHEINDQIHALRANHYKIETQINELIEETEHLIEDIEDIDVPDRADDSPPTRNTNRTAKEVKVTLEQCRKLLNKKVRIINPNAGEPNEGVIRSVGTFFVHVTKTNGDRTKRAAKNLRLIQDE